MQYLSISGKILSEYLTEGDIFIFDETISSDIEMKVTLLNDILRNQTNLTNIGLPIGSLDDNGNSSENVFFHGKIGILKNGTTNGVAEA